MESTCPSPTATLAPRPRTGNFPCVTNAARSVDIGQHPCERADRHADRQLSGGEIQPTAHQSGGATAPVTSTMIAEASKAGTSGPTRLARAIASPPQRISLGILR